MGFFKKGKEDNGNGNGQADVKEDSSWHCTCGAMGKCVKGDESMLLSLHKSAGCPDDK